MWSSRSGSSTGRGDLEPPGADELALVGPERGRVVERVVVGGELEAQLEGDRAVAGEALGEVLVEVVAAARLRLVVCEPLLARLGDPAQRAPGPLAVGVDEVEGVGRVVDARWRSCASGPTPTVPWIAGLRLRVGAEEGAELLEVRLAGLGIGAAQLEQLEELLGRAGDERRRGRRQDVGLLAAVAAQLDREPARLALGVVGLGIARALEKRISASIGSPAEVEGAGERGRPPGWR